ncbi:hypothetical protein [Streptomyces sp. NPDC057302]|uniref:hypothetical protein n=1 Tax=Streptomyces sp. NPDC057302 TaxID=3346094 RepID=UPI00362620DB
MPEETAPPSTTTSTTTAPTDTATTPPRTISTPSLLGRIGCGCVSLVGLVVLVVAVPLIWSSSGSTDYPRVAPKEMGDRAFQRSQEAYDVLGFTRRVEPGGEDIGVSTQNTFSTDFCYDGGLLGLEDKTVDGAYAMSHSWALDHVPASRAVSGLRRLHKELKDDGWNVTSYRKGTRGGDWDLFVKRDDGDERMSFTWYADREYFTGGASVPCAYDPEWKSGDTGPPADQESPRVLGPT